MQKEVSSLNIQYGVAFIAAPVFCFLYITIFKDKAVDIYWLFSDRKALFF